MRKQLQFTCPECGSHRLEQVTTVRNVIDAVYDNPDPAYDWYEDPDGNIVLGAWFYVPYSLDDNFYRCEQCDTPLLDDVGREFWGENLLAEWLKTHREETK